MPKRFAYLDGQKVARREAEKIASRAAERNGTAEKLETVYVRKETLRAVWRALDRGRTGNLNELVEDLLHRWLSEHEGRASSAKSAKTSAAKESAARKPSGR